MSEEQVREALVWLTGHIEDPDVAGALFAAGLILSEYVFIAIRKVWN